MAFEKEHEEFIVIGVNLSIAKNDDEKHLYKEDDLYFEPNNVGYYGIVWISCIYDYYVLYLGFKTINNFFFRTIFKPIKKVYIFEETKYWIFTIRIAIYGIFIPSLEHLPMNMKEGIILEGY